MSDAPRPPIESGCPDGFQYMHPLMRKHYGNWDYHEDPQPGVLKHVAKNGEVLFTVKAGTQRILDVFTLWSTSWKPKVSSSAAPATP